MSLVPEKELRAEEEEWEEPLHPGSLAAKVPHFSPTSQHELHKFSHPSPCTDPAPRFLSVHAVFAGWDPFWCRRSCIPPLGLRHAENRPVPSAQRVLGAQWWERGGAAGTNRGGKRR